MPMPLDRLKGSIPPLITPFKDGEVDYRSFERLVERQITEGSHGVLINGTTSEPATLTLEERNKTCDIAIGVAGGQIPVVVATGSQSFAETKVLTDHAVKAGADTLLIVTPYYTRPPQRGIIKFYLDITKRHDVPWMIYHIPGRAAVTVTLETVQELKEMSPTFVGMKHAAKDLDFVSDCLAAVGNDFKIFVGLEDLSFPMMAVGACGLMNAVGNLRPAVLTELCQAVWDGKLAHARALHDLLHEINKAVFFDTNPIPIKYMAKKLGIIERNEHRLPMMPATPELEKRLDAVLLRAGLL
jgi:4-hydroxy-tetrahydrodipicolinate synthase